MQFYMVPTVSVCVGKTVYAGSSMWEWGYSMCVWGHGFAQTACLITMKRDPLEDH